MSTAEQISHIDEIDRTAVTPGAARLALVGGPLANAEIDTGQYIPPCEESPQIQYNHQPCAIEDLPHAIAQVISRRRYSVARSTGMTADLADKLTVAEVNQRFFNHTED